MKTHVAEMGVSVGPGLSAKIHLQTSVTYFPDRLVIPYEEVAKFFSIDDIIIGKTSVKALPGPLRPLFASSSFNVNIRPTVCWPSMFVTVLVTNVSNESRLFKATVVGRKHPSDLKETT